MSNWSTPFNHLLSILMYLPLEMPSNYTGLPSLAEAIVAMVTCTALDLAKKFPFKAIDVKQLQFLFGQY
jgi:hypothetical protein